MLRGNALRSRSLSADEPPHIDSDEGRRDFATTKSFNRDIAGTLFAPLFFSLRHRNQDSEAAPRRRCQRPSPFEDPSCARAAETMLRRMVDDRRRRGGRTVCPDNATFGLVVGGFGRLKCGSSGDRRVVTWEEEFDRGGVDDRVDASSPGTRQMTPGAKLEQLLKLQLQLCHAEGWPAEIRPSVDMYNRMLKRLAWQSRSSRVRKRERDISSAEQAWLWLQCMKSPVSIEGQGEAMAPVCCPDAKSYLHVIDALSSCRAPLSLEAETAHSRLLAKAADEPIEVWAKRLGIAINTERSGLNHSLNWHLGEAEQLLVGLEERYHEDAAEGDIQNKEALARGCACLLEGWGRYAVQATGASANTPKDVGDDVEHAVTRALELLGRLESLAKAGGPVPSRCYSSVMLALSVSTLSSAPAVADDVLERMMRQYGQRPSIDADAASFFSLAFSGCIGAHAKNNDAPNAEKVLNKMIDVYHAGTLGSGFVPEARAFGTCIALWSKYSPEHARTKDDENAQPPDVKGEREPLRPYQQCRHNADRAEAILAELEHVAEIEASKGNDNFVLRAKPYNAAIMARVKTIDAQPSSPHKRSRYDTKEENMAIILHAQSMLDRLEQEMGVTPDPYTYSILLSAWCRQSCPGRQVRYDHV